VARNKEEPAIYGSAIIKTTDGKAEFSIDSIRELYINSDKTLEELSIQMNLPVEVVKRHAEQGMQSWYKLKQDKFADRMKYFMTVNIDNLTETHSLLEDGHFLTIVQMKGLQERLKEHYMKHGHLFRVDGNGDICLDPYGMPITLPIPNSPKHFMALESCLSG
jgi:hypothetical protein